jgi:hypothetical protein
MNQILLFSLIAMASPTLLAATTVMLLARDARAVMLGFLLGAMLMGVGIGVVVVVVLQQGSRAVSTVEHQLSPALDVALGVAFLAVACVLGTGGHRRLAERRRRSRTGKAPPRWQRALDGASPRVTFGIGALLALPSASYLAALGGVAKLDLAAGDAVLLVLLVNVIRLLILEVPLAGLVLAPAGTPAALQRGRAWFGVHGHVIAVVGPAVLGALLVARGLVELG